MSEKAIGTFVQDTPENCVDDEKGHYHVDFKYNFPSTDSPKNMTIGPTKAYGHNFNGKVFLMECTNSFEETLLLNGDFKENADSWELTGNAILTEDARFSGHYGINLRSGTIKQTVTVSNNYCYFLHWYQKGDITIAIHNKTNNKYWNYETKTWNSSIVNNEFAADNWINKSMYFSLKDIFTGNSDIEIIINGNSENENYIDFLFLFQKKKLNSFTIVIQYEGDIAEGTLSVAEGSEDNPDLNTPPNVLVKVENWSYFDQTYLTGPVSGYSSDIYNELLDYVRTVGYQAQLEFVTKDYIA